ncbi:MAG TPA: MarR family transcriptional regulator [Acidimicrobiales bacterium]|nr:MarR family transcriptional regulator [Acidimicrobiales bacterium]
MAGQRPLRFDPIAEARRQWRRRRWDSAAWMAAATSIMRAQQLVLKEVDDALRPYGLTFARYESLVLLYFSRQQSLPLGKMGDRLMVHPASVTNAINQLERDGLVRRVAHGTDRRKVLAELTDEGRAVVEAATKAVTAVRFGLSGLNAREADQLSGLIQGLRLRSGDFTA